MMNTQGAEWTKDATGGLEFRRINAMVNGGDRTAIAVTKYPNDNVV
jgi:hypothetical protein